MNMSSSLLPCPFCGVTGEILSDGKHEWALFAHKDSCLFPNLHKHEIPACDFEAWNTRAAYEMDGWFYLPKPKQQLFNYTTGFSFDDLSLKLTGTTDVYAITDAVQKWQEEALNAQIIERICEVFKPERTCKCVYRDCGDGFGGYYCTSCGEYMDASDRYCPNCGLKVVE